MSVGGKASADSYTITISSPMDLGSVVAASTGDTVFRIVPQGGNVNKISGNGRRLSNTLVRSLVTISCVNDNSKQDNWDHDSGGGNNKTDCSRDRAYVVIGTIGFTTARARPLTNFTVSMTSASLASSVTGTNPIYFQLNPVGNNQSKSFYVGADFPVAGDDSGRSTGTGLSPFYVYVTDGSGNTLGALLSAGTVTSFRSISVSKTADLRFGIVSQAKTSGAITINPSTGARTITGGGYGFPTPAWGPASFTVSGEGGQTLSISIPGNLQLSGPTNLNVTPNSTITGTPTLSGSVGSAGSYTFNVGGSFPIANGSIIGTYSGTLTVNIDYN